MSHLKPNVMAPAASNGQYQHFVPQFLLKNFAHRVPKAPKGPKGTPKPKYEKGMFPGDLVISSLDLTQDAAVFTEKPVSRILGQINMYDDFTKPNGEQRHVEKLLSKLEAQAAHIFTKITKAYEAKEGGVVLTRDERNLIRKFLFLMKYRGHRFHTRFFHERPEAYSENDRELLCEYMEEHPQFKTPMQIWLHNIETLINLEMDPELNWIRELPKKMYYNDAMWFVTHVQSCYMALCVPSEAENEFILADNSYSVYEGPNKYARDIKSNKEEALGYVELHTFAPVSPKIMVVLRSWILPQPLEDQSPEVKEDRDFQRSLVMDPYGHVNGMLADLPVRKAENSYSEIVNGRLVFQEGYDGRRGKDDKFRFPFFPIESQHVNIINSIFLDNCLRCTSLVYNSKQAFARTLEWYLTAPPLEIGKIFTGEDKEDRLKTLKKLEAVSRSLGSEKAALWVMPTLPPTVQDHEKIRLRHLERHRKSKNAVVNDERIQDPHGEAFLKSMMEQNALTWGLSEPAAPYMDNYFLLGGSYNTVLEDIDQVVKMNTLRIKIDSWSQGVDEAIRQRNRESLVSEYLRLPSPRLWLYIQAERDMIMEHEGIDLLSPQGDWLGMPENAIVRAKKLIRPDRLNTLMYIAFKIDTRFRQRAHLNIRTEFAPFIQGAGPIMNCGIQQIEDLAKSTDLLSMAIVADVTLRNADPTLNSQFKPPERLELIVRSTCREMFATIMEPERIKHNLSRQVIEDLEKVLFTLVYPTPP
ncbi:hypothetical protein QBC32DRAFT_354635 [Pseudoneurospora amorphoporcata]|uniref:DUF4238 domain-containing protein n=1 Tax=Pseudoneurospora amorphoporcata TaxID=241081 RepID=A0AAN6NPB8_9PEZI|nr:hypothetical protein QBC32DRAFT_354635 [Pseudoneurospora amorphoporcata]